MKIAKRNRPTYLCTLFVIKNLFINSATISFQEYNPKFIISISIKNLLITLIKHLYGCNLRSIVLIFYYSHLNKMYENKSQGKYIVHKSKAILRCCFLSNLLNNNIYISNNSNRNTWPLVKLLRFAIYW